MVLARSDVFQAFPPEDTVRPLVARFEEFAVRGGTRLAIHDQSGDWNYARVNAAANQMAGRLFSVAADPGQPVALLFESSAALVIAILAVLKTGNFYVPFDPHQPPERLRLLFAESGAAVLLCDPHFAALAGEIAPPGKLMPLFPALTADCTVDPGTVIAADAPAYVLYTSGSTGEPKGVIQTHRNVLADIRRLTNDFQVTAGDRFALLFYPWFSASIGPVFGALLNGASVHLYSIAHRGTAQLADWLRQQEITICDISLGSFRQLTSAPASRPGFPSIRMLGLGGERVTRFDFDSFRTHFAPGTILQNGYGTTETRTISQYLLTHDSEFAGDVVPVGWPVEGKTVVIEREDGAEAMPGEPGEIVVRSRYLSPGYWRRPDLTAGAFSSSRVGDERLYRTGDAGMRLPDGCLIHLGRLDSQVKIRGHRVEPAEVEAAILRTNQCREAAVVPYCDDKGNARMAAWIVASAPRTNNAVPGISSVRAHLARELPIWMIPHRFVWLEWLPRLANGKVNLRALPPVPQSRPELETPFAAPQDSLECKIAELVSKILGIDRPGVNDDFHDLGGDSLQAVELLAALDKELKQEIPLSVFLQNPTVAELARVVRQTGSASRKQYIIPVRSGGSRPPLFCFPGVTGEPAYSFRLARLLGPDQPVYALCSRATDPSGSTRESLRAMAAGFAKQIQEVHPDQPACLFGFSLAGLLAQECARQLAAMGRRLGPLILVDPMDLGKHRRGWQLLWRINSRIYETAARSRPDADAPLKASARISSAGQRVAGAMRRAVRTHRPQPYSGSAIFFAPAIRRAIFPQERHAPWRELITGGLEVRTVPGDHAGILRYPNIEHFAKQLREVLAG